MPAPRTGQPVPKRTTRRAGTPPGYLQSRINGSETAYGDIKLLRQANRRELRRRQLIARIYRLGPRAILELIEEMIRHGLVDERELFERFEAYAALDPIALRVAGADRLTSPPVWRCV